MRQRDTITLGRRAWQLQPGDPGYVPPVADNTEALDRMRYEADTAKAEAARVKKQLEEIQKQLPSEEQRVKWAELEAEAALAEEERAKKKGDFDQLREQLNAKHQKEIDAVNQMKENIAAKQTATETELNDTLVGREFADASDLFGPAGKTVWFPAVAQAYFKNNVEVEIVAGTNGAPSRRRVVVKDLHGTIIIDPKTGQPMLFAKAMADLIDAHPQKNQILRGSGKVGANSPGGVTDVDGQLDTSRLKAKDFADPKVREAVRSQSANAGGLQNGPAFDRMKQQTRK